jgi:hypothetical protein
MARPALTKIAFYAIPVLDHVDQGQRNKCQAVIIMDDTYQPAAPPEHKHYPGHSFK